MSCTGTCAALPSVTAPSSSFSIPTTTGPIVVTFAQTLPVADVDRDALVAGPTGALGSGFSITGISGAAGSYSAGLYATDGAGNLKALVLEGAGGKGVFYSSCGPFIVQSGTTRKRALTSAQTIGLGGAVTTSAGGDPHLKGLFGIAFDVFGEPSANYSLLATPAFAVNMQVAQFGPELRYMTQMSVLYRGTSIAMDAWSVVKRKAELVAHFEALGAKVAIEGWSMTVELCAQHVLVFTSMHSTDGSEINFLDVEVRVPGCHDAYGGLLGQTYQCKYAREAFAWSRDKEAAFRVPTLETPSGAYAGPTAECAKEDEYAGAPISGAMQHSDGAATITSLRR